MGRAWDRGTRAGPAHCLLNPIRLIFSHMTAAFLLLKKRRPPRSFSFPLPYACYHLFHGSPSSSHAGGGGDSRRFRNHLSVHLNFQALPLPLPNFMATVRALGKTPSSMFGSIKGYALHVRISQEQIRQALTDCNSRMSQEFLGDEGLHGR